MRNAFHLLVLISLATAAAFAAASAQDSPPDLDLAEIRARASEHAQDAEALATSVRTRADTLAEDARTTQQAALDNRAAYVKEAQASAGVGPLDLDGMIRSAADAEVAAMGEVPRFIAFASLSMAEHCSGKTGPLAGFWSIASGHHGSSSFGGIHKFSATAVWSSLFWRYQGY